MYKITPGVFLYIFGPDPPGPEEKPPYGGFGFDGGLYKI